MVRQICDSVRRTCFALAFRDVGAYWERRYAAGGTSGAGSYGELATYKAEFLNGFVRKQNVQTVIELGCGDGNQLSLADYPRYLGLDISKTAIDRCQERFRSDSTKAFLWYDPARAMRLADWLQVDLTLSLDVIYHLVEDAAYDIYLDDLFSLSRKFVIVYSSNKEGLALAPHVRYRQFTVDVAKLFPSFRLMYSEPNRYPNQSDSQFFVFQRT